MLIYLYRVFKLYFHIKTSFNRFKQMDSNKFNSKPLKTDYEKFQEWLNNCPVEIIDYQDYTDTFDIKFKVPLD